MIFSQITYLIRVIVISLGHIDKIRVVSSAQDHSQFSIDPSNKCVCYNSALASETFSKSKPRITRIMTWILGIFVMLTACGVGADQFVIYNQQTDEYVGLANNLSKSDPIIDLEDIHPNLPIFTLPMLGPFYMAVDGFQGEMGDKRTLSRLFDAKKYSSSCNETLTSVFQYDDLTIEYNYVLADFLYFFKFTADLKLRIDANSFRTSITKTCTECKVNALEVQDFQDYDTEVTIIGSKINPINWMMKWLLAYGFRHFNTYFIINIINHQVEDLFRPFIQTYCTHENPQKYKFT